MKYITKLPFESIAQDDDYGLDCIVYKSAKNVCEFQNDQFKMGLCDTSGHYYGTSDEREPKFCARHFYQNVVNSKKQKFDGGSHLSDDMDLKKQHEI